jgi:transcriptional regulator with XRE-family HTH domain
MSKTTKALTAWRTANGLTAKEFAAKIGVNKSTLYRIENGEIVPTLGTAFALERATGGKIPAEAWVK